MIGKRCAMTEALARECAKWRYDKPYELYNFPDWDVMQREQWVLCTKQGREQFLAYVDESLQAFVRLKE